MTMQLEHQAPRTHRRKKAAVVAGIVGGLFGVAGIAVAAMLLTTTISGTVSFADTAATQTVSDVSGTNDGLDCTSAAAANGGAGITVNPKIKRINQVQQAGSCLITGTLNNTGQAALRLVSVGIDNTPPGYTLEFTNVTPGETIAGGASKVITVRLSATATAPVGAFTAKLTTEVVGA